MAMSAGAGGVEGLGADSDGLKLADREGGDGVIVGRSVGTGTTAIEEGDVDGSAVALAGRNATASPSAMPIATRPAAKITATARALVIIDRRYAVRNWIGIP